MGLFDIASLTENRGRSAMTIGRNRLARSISYCFSTVLDCGTTGVVSEEEGEGVLLTLIVMPIPIPINALIIETIVVSVRRSEKFSPVLDSDCCSARLLLDILKRSPI